MIGTNAWGANAPINYLVAKQLWNAQLDVSATLDEWLQRAYGPGWRHMRQMHDELDARMLAHKEAQSPIYNGGQYEANEPVMKAIYAPLLPPSSSITATRSRNVPPTRSVKDSPCSATISFCFTTLCGKHRSSQMMASPSSIAMTLRLQPSSKKWSPP